MTSVKTSRGEEGEPVGVWGRGLGPDDPPPRALARNISPRCMASLGGALVFGTLMVYSFQQAAMYNQNLQEVGEQIVLNSGQ